MKLWSYKSNTGNSIGASVHKIWLETNVSQFQLKCEKVNRYISS